MQANDFFNSLEVDIKKYELLECDYGAIIIRIVDIFYENDDLENTSFFLPISNDKEKRELGLLFKKCFMKKESIMKCFGILTMEYTLLVVVILVIGRNTNYLNILCS